MILKLLFKIGFFFFRIFSKFKKKKKVVQHVYDTTSPVVTPSFKMNKNTLQQHSEKKLSPSTTIEVTPENISGIINLINTRQGVSEEFQGPSVQYFPPGIIVIQAECDGAGAGSEWKDESYQYLHGNPCAESAEFPPTVRIPVSDSIDTNQVDPVADVNIPEPTSDYSSESDYSTSSDSTTSDSE